MHIKGFRQGVKYYLKGVNVIWAYLRMSHVGGGMYYPLPSGLLDFTLHTLLHVLPVLIGVLLYVEEVLSTL